MTDSCFIAKLGHYIDLSTEEKQLLAALERDERDYPRHATVYQYEDVNRSFHIVRRGWLYSYIDLPDGRRQIVRVHQPGDLIGLPDLAFRQTTSALRACSETVICPMPKNALDTIFRRAPRLTALLFTLSNRDQVVFLELLRAIARMDARERLAHFLLDLASRLRITNPGMGSSFRLPLSQQEIADTIGLTNVYVSKTLGRLERDGMIARDGDRITLTDEPGLVELCSFVNRYQQVDTEWFPISDTAK